ncbi:GntR family transcriptional regulator [Streptacidiphilus fuscans]|uniref:GntR family transcriptional regulator n=1 Tax=Streptacidiphilus fuscans TaxID=2789292 RepID=A0A931B7J3_9ACTN|nr:GntR family transcriptional regulator [Streptacidiphilus fuscans]MBF9071874.1 GntR family transcriptional regulator [Streptacidiphilus fuscans]
MPLKYEEIAESLRRDIAAGQYPLGSALPSGRDLCERWSVSRATVNKALELLKADALVTSRQGSRYVVVALPMGRPAGSRGSGTARADGALPFTRLGVPDMLVPPLDVAEALGVEPEVTALRRGRLMHLPDGTPQSYVVAWFPAWIVDAAPKLAGAAAIPEGTTRYVRRCTGLVSVLGRDLEHVRLAAQVEADVLGLQLPAAVHVTLHSARDDQGRALVVEEGVTPDSVWQRSSEYPMGESS